jgi:hypothetical protein
MKACFCYQDPTIEGLFLSSRCSKRRPVFAINDGLEGLLDVASSARSARSATMLQLNLQGPTSSARTIDEVSDSMTLLARLLYSVGRMY